MPWPFGEREMGQRPLWVMPSELYLVWCLDSILVLVHTFFLAFQSGHRKGSLLCRGCWLLRILWVEQFASGSTWSVLILVSGSPPIGHSLWKTWWNCVLLEEEEGKDISLKELLVNWFKYVNSVNPKVSKVLCKERKLRSGEMNTCLKFHPPSPVCYLLQSLKAKGKDKQSN